MGIDVAIARGLDIVVLADSLRVVFSPPLCTSSTSPTLSAEPSPR